MWNQWTFPPSAQSLMSAVCLSATCWSKTHTRAKHRHTTHTAYSQEKSFFNQYVFVTIVLWLQRNGWVGVYSEKLILSLPLRYKKMTQAVHCKDFILGSASHFKNMLTTEDKACKHKVEVTVQHYKAECNNRACKHKHTQRALSHPRKHFSC